MNMLTPRTMETKTKLTDSPIVLVVSPETDFGKKIAYKIVKIVSQFNRNTTLVINPEPKILYSCNGPLILIGNLADSKCIKEMYEKFLCITDLWYPGPGGYELRTIINPFNTGFNIIHLGYSDENGLIKAEKLLEEKIVSGTIPYLREIWATRLHFPKSKAQQLQKDKIDLNDPTIYLTANIDEKAYLAFMTGDKQLLEEYYSCWKVLLNLPAIHLMLYKKVVVWRLLEAYGMIPEKMRGQIVNYFYSWANGAEGVGSLDEKIYQTPNFPRQNHGLIPALGLLYLYDYFTRFYPELKEPKHWKEKSEIVFQPYCCGSWKTLCDGLCHGLWLSQPALFDFGMLDPKHIFFKNNSARKAADYDVAVINSQGYIPNAGDSDILRQFPGYCLCAAAAYYHDPEYEYVYKRTPESQRGYCGPITYPPRSFEIGVPTSIPKDKIGITISAVDPIVYNAWNDHPGIAEQAVDTYPEAPIEKCFDKLTMRTGWNITDDYLLIDGLGGGSHSYADAMSILDYQNLGISWIVAEDSLHWPEPENHSMLTIYKDGKKEKVPAFAELLGTRKDQDGNMYAAMRLKNFNGADWIREIFLVPHNFVAFHDTVICLTEGNYSIEDHFRIPGAVKLDEQGVSTTRILENGSRIYFKLLSRCSKESNNFIKKVPLGINYRTQPGKTKSITPETDPASSIRKRYHFRVSDEIFLTQFTSRTFGKMEKGDKVSFTHVVYTSRKQEHPEIYGKNGEYKLINDSTTVTLPFIYGYLNLIHRENCKSHSYKTGFKSLRSFDSQITATEIMQDGSLLCGLKNGKLFELDEFGNSKLFIQMAGEIHTISSAGCMGRIRIFVGYGESGLSEFDENGNILWKKKIKRIPTLYPWWELNYPTVIKAVAMSDDKKIYVLTGCGDNYVRKYSENGILISAHYFFASVPGIIKLADVDHDGKLEAIVAGGIMSADSGIEILGQDNVCRIRFASEGWVSRTTALAFIPKKEYSVIACGVNHRHNLQLFRFNYQKNPGKVSQKMKGLRLIYKEMAGAVTGIEMDSQKEILFVCTSQGFIGAFDFHGNELWMKMIKSAATQIKLFHEKIIITDNSGTIYIFDINGSYETSYFFERCPLKLLCGLNKLYLIYGSNIREITEI